MRASAVRSWFVAAVVCAAVASACGSQPSTTSDTDALAPPVTARVRPGTYPLQQWMRANAATALDSGDPARIERALRRAAELGPDEPAFARWRPLAVEGADAAARHDLEAVRQSCKHCHEALRTAYRATLRGRTLGP